MGFPLKLAQRRPKAPETALLGLLRGVPLLPGLERSWPEVLALAERALRAPLIEVVDLAHLFRRCDPAMAVARARQARLLPQLGAALLLLERCAAAARRFGGAEVDHARIPRLDLPGELGRAVDGFELAAEPARPGALLQVARALGLIAEQGSVE